MTELILLAFCGSQLLMDSLSEWMRTVRRKKKFHQWLRNLLLWIKTYLFMEKMSLRLPRSQHLDPMLMDPKSGW
jgi:hypothetical protein